MAINFSEQFSQNEGDRVYKGVHISRHSANSNRGNPQYSFQYVWKAPRGLRFGASPGAETQYHWVTERHGPAPYEYIKKAVNDYLARGYTVRPSGHMVGEGFPD